MHHETEITSSDTVQPTARQRPLQEKTPGRIGKIRCILFDVGDTLWERTELNEETFTPAINASILAILQDHIPTRRWLGRRPEEVISQFRSVVFKLANQSILSDIEHEPDIPRLINHALKELRLPPVPIAVARDIFDALRTPLRETRQLFPDTIETLQALRDRGYLLGLVTNRFYGGQKFLEELEAFKLLEFFPAKTIATSADLGLRKPHPEIFRYALDRLNVDVQETAMVGDNLIADVAAAAQLQVHTVWYPHRQLRTRFQQQGEAEQTGHDDDTAALYRFARAHHRLIDTRYPAVEPDYTITQLSDLLTIFPDRQTEAGNRQKIGKDK